MDKENSFLKKACLDIISNALKSKKIEKLYIPMDKCFITGIYSDTTLISSEFGETSFEKLGLELHEYIEITDKILKYLG